MLKKEDKILNPHKNVWFLALEMAKNKAARFSIPDKKVQLQTINSFDYSF